MSFRTAGAFMLSAVRHTFRGLSSTPLCALSPEDDDAYMLQAVECAQKGFGHTFPNPAVGCVLVSSSDNPDDRPQVLGQGFHPRAGFPHAEIFALLQAAGHVQDGVQAALSVVRQQEDDVIRQLTKQYASDDGPNELFGGVFANHPHPVTAYVTLEPCCHYGKTPPCAASLALAKVDRVVVGFRDPNPRVDGGGVQFLQDRNVPVDFVTSPYVAQKCQGLVTNFCKRIAPRSDESWPADSYNESVTGAMRRALRAAANRGKQDGSLAEVSWGTSGVNINTTDDLLDAISRLPLKAEWMEHVDAVLWQHELVLLRLNSAVGKRKGAKLLGERIAKELQAHVAQTVGHTVLLYRPGIPPVIDLEQMVRESKNPNEEK